METEVDDRFAVPTSEDIAAFFQAIQWGKTADMTASLETFGTNIVNQKNDQGDTPLIYSIWKDVTEKENYKLLIAAGAEVNAQCSDGNTAAMYAAWTRDNPTCLQALIKAGADTEIEKDNGENVLKFAAGRGHLQCLNLLLDQETDIQKQNLKIEEALREAYSQEVPLSIEVLKERLAKNDQFLMTKQGLEKPLLLPQSKLKLQPLKKTM